ncbi:MAG: hypothetical protein WCG47_09185 [Dermatophilaceae bacterium]
MPGLRVQLGCPGRDAATRSRLKGRDEDNTQLVSQRHRVLKGLLEVTPVDQQFGAEAGHQRILVRAVALALK